MCCHMTSHHDLMFFVDVDFPSNCGVNMYDNLFKKKKLTDDDVLEMLRNILQVEQLDTRVMGGVEAMKGQFPWIVRVAVDGPDDEEGTVSYKLYF